MLCGHLGSFVIYSMVLGTSYVKSASNIFSTIVFIQWVGAAVLTIVIKLLGVQVYVLFIILHTLVHSSKCSQPWVIRLFL